MFNIPLTTYTGGFVSSYSDPPFVACQECSRLILYFICFVVSTHLNSALDLSYLPLLSICLALARQALIVMSPLAKPVITSACSDRENHQGGACTLYGSARTMSLHSSV